MNTYGFELIKELNIRELNIFARFFRHRKTGAELLSLEASDENKVFGVTFRTPPSNSTGLPHIMEHAVLCGSDKYPLKEPFVELLKGSLNTFLNAFTFPDKTCYPVASQNLQDFYNLIDVYVDAVFHPLIPPHILEQEGWHYELDSPTGEMSYKGVVFNEMKGAYSDPENILSRYARQSLFPGTPYGFDSGGDPEDIPDLTYGQFKRFHERYYHPSNARIFFYGDDDPQERLRLMDGYLNEFEASPVDSAIPLQTPSKSYGRLDIAYDPGEGEDEAKAMLVVNWLLPETSDPQLTLALQILTHILLGTPASPLRKALIESGLGEDLAGDGLESHLRQMTFSTGLKGIKPKDGEKVENLIFDTLGSLVSEGIDPETVAASMNTIEFVLRESNTGAFPRGLTYMLRSLTTWLYDADPLSPLAFEDPLTAIKTSLESDGRYFERLIREHLVVNVQRTVVTLQPEAGLRARQEAEEKARLATIQSEMSTEEIHTIYENTQRLKQIQETPDPPEALATIPNLLLEDLEKGNKLIPLSISELAGIKLYTHNLFTNGILYLDLGLDLHTLPGELLPYVPLFGRALFEIGTESQDFVRLSQRIGRYTGGIYARPWISMSEGGDQSAAWLFLRGKSTVERAGELMDILRDVLLTVNLDNQERFRQMVLEAKASREASLVSGGHIVVNTRLRGRFDEAGWANEKIGGVDYLFFLRDLAQAVEKDWTAVLDKLHQVHEILVNKNAIVANVTLDDNNVDVIKPLLAGLFENLPSKPVSQHTWSPVVGSADEGMTIPAQVNYVGKGANLYKSGYQQHGSINVINKYLQTTWLWERVRVQGGAYGGFSVFDRRSGVFTYISYRDPNLLSTLESFDRSADFLRQLDLSEGELTKSIVGSIGDMDAYQLPDAKGFTSLTRHLCGDTDERRQQWREQILSTSVDDFKAFADVLEGVKENGQVVILGSQEALEAANTGRDGWLELRNVL